MAERFRGLALAILIGTLSACAAGLPPRAPTFPQEEAPSEMIVLAQAHLEKKLKKNYGSSPTYNYHLDTLELAGAQKLILDDRDASNNVREQWCVVFRYDLERGDPETVVESFSIYQMNLKRYGWIPTFIAERSDAFFYQQIVLDTWERCIGY